MSRSSKTYSICQMLILYAIQNPNKEINVFRKTLADAKKSVLKTFIKVIEDLKIGHLYTYKKSECSFAFNNKSNITFYGTENEEKIKGLESDVIYVNEANELTYEDKTQIFMRSTGKIIIDYNPSSNMSWIYDMLSNQTIKDEIVEIHSTYKDNPFITEQQRRIIENYKNTDPTLYQIYALGLRATSKENVFGKWQVVKEKPAHIDQFIYGLDFGYVHPLALTKVWYNNDTMELYLEELIYESGLEPPQMIQRFKDLNIEKDVTIVADYARPELINDLRNNGYSVHNAIKDVRDGIMNMRSYKIYVNDFAVNIIKENDLYRYKKLNGQITDEVIKRDDDLIDSIRYAVFHIKKYLQHSNYIDFGY